MIIIEALMLTILVMTLAFCSYTDCRESIIRNRTLVKAATAVTVLDTIYYVAYGSQYLPTFLMNAGLLAVVSLLLYAFKIWAGGDSKLLLLIAIAIPGRLYALSGADVSGILIIVFAFLSAFLVVVLHSLAIGVRNGDLLHVRTTMRLDAGRILASYAMLVGIVQVFDCAMRRFVPSVVQGDWMLAQTMYCILVLMLIYIRGRMTSRHIGYATAVSWLAVLALSMSGVYALQYAVSLSILAWACLLLGIRVLVEKYNYQTIPTSEVKKGHILAASTIMEFQRSRVKGLPCCMTEYLEARLTEEEADSVHRWEKSKYGSDTVVIVRKIPFAIFLAIGTILFFAVEVISQ